MCGIVSLCYASDNPRLGFEAGELLKRLEYRGYDSTGGAFVDAEGAITLLKAVGAPSRVVPELGIDRQHGERFIGQVRWATYGSVTQENAQPHQMACRLPFVGAHNGNIANTDTLKGFLADRGHQAVSDNDGEMIVHLTEHYYAANTADETVLPALRAKAAAGGVHVPDSALLLLDGARQADAMADGSYAAAFCDPASPGVVAVKSGSSLYAGLGADEAGEFVVVSSDLTSVLSKTSRLIPLVEGQGLWFTHDRYVVFNLAGPLELTVPEPKVSKLNVSDTSLNPPFEYYMDQEIASVPENLATVAAHYLGEASGVAVRERLVGDLKAADAQGGRVFLVASGTSYHAALTGAYFFDRLARLAVFPCNPGMFRSLYLDALHSEDVVIGITQSGETKDLVDILVDVADRFPSVRRVSLVNNENSRIPQELSDYHLPLLCGPEIAVAATKSFVNQLAVLYLVAGSFSLSDADLRATLDAASGLVIATLRDTAEGIDEAAQRLCQEPSLHILGSSLIGVAREGALKIREVVLNHAEGYDAAEFKHGPNTILGKNTIFSVDDLARLLDAYEAGRSASALGSKALAARPDLIAGLFRNYPLVFVCPPDARDARITISQIHTHKIRGADILLFAEPDADLRLAVEGVPAGVEGYWARVIELPVSGDPCLFVFGASVALQRLAFRMSELKMHALDALGVADHGVHPDVPKNVSKSITVD